MERKEFIQCIVGSVVTTLLPVGGALVEDSSVPEASIAILSPTYVDAFKIFDRDGSMWFLPQLSRICKELCNSDWKDISIVDSEGYRTVRCFARDGSNDYAGYGEATLIYSGTAGK